MGYCKYIYLIYTSSSYRIRILYLLFYISRLGAIVGWASGTDLLAAFKPHERAVLAASTYRGHRFIFHANHRLCIGDRLSEISAPWSYCG